MSMNSTTSTSLPTTRRPSPPKTAMDELMALHRWMMWRYVNRGPEKKPTKKPLIALVNALGVQDASSTDASTWRSYYEATEAFKKKGHNENRMGWYEGIAIALGDLRDGRHLCGLDLDACLDANGHIAVWAQHILALLCATYVEVSPSGTGLKAYFYVSREVAAAARPLFGIKANSWGCRRSVGDDGGDHGPATEVYLGNGRMFCVTGRLWPHAANQIATFDAALLQQLAGLIPTAARSSTTGKGGGPADTSRSAVAYRLGRTMKRQGRSFDDFVQACRTDPATAEWCAEKGEANDQRELHRIWDKADARDDLSPTQLLVEEFNKKYLVVNEAGKVVILQPTYDAIHQRTYYNRMAFADFHRLYLNRLVEAGIKLTKKGKDEIEETQYKTASDVWISHPERRQYIDGVTFDPTNSQPNGVLNLWEGFHYQPKPGRWDRLREHIWTVICRQNEGDFWYLMRWMARMLQYPAQHGEVAVVMRGVQGSGKGTLARALRHLIGQHAMAISNPDHLVGKFNLHLRDCVFLFPDECFYAGDRKHIGVLKALITEETLAIEAKGVNVVSAPSYLHIMMATNEKWAVPVELEDRRTFMLDVSDERVGDFAYFNAIWAELEDGGFEAMLYELTTMDISKFNVRDRPTTTALQEQKQENLDLDYRWWQDVLYRGYVFASKLGLEADFQCWQSGVSTELLFASYEAYAQKHRHRRPLHRNTFGVFLLKMGGKPSRRHWIIGEHMVDKVDVVGRGAALIYGRRPGYTFGELDEARAEFNKRTKLGIDWTEPPDE
jgi:hypothetical protein